MSKEEFTALKDTIANKFLTEYEGQRVDAQGADQNGVAEIEKQTQDL